MALLDSKQLNPRLTGSFTLSGSFAGDSSSSGSFGRLEISGNSNLVGRLIAGENIQLSNAQQVQWGGLNNAIFGHSSQNYVHIKTGGSDRVKINSSKVFKQLAKTGILVRKMDVYGIKNSLRITIGKSDENRKLISKMKKILNV